jgi:hypothetical protein
VYVVLALVLACAQNGATRRFAAYLGQERNLRQTIYDESALNDSLEALQKRFAIDRTRQLERLSKNPENWLHLLEALENAQ